MTSPAPVVEERAHLSPRAAFRLARPWTWIVPVAALVWGPGWDLVRLSPGGLAENSLWRIAWETQGVVLLLTVAVVATAFVAAGHRRLWVIPIALVVLGQWAVIQHIQIFLEPGPFFTAGGGQVFLEMLVEDLFNGAIFGSRPWVGTMVEVGLLVAMPIKLLRTAPLTSPPTLDHHDLAGLAFVVVAVGMLAYLWDVFAPYGGAGWSELETYLLLFVVGAGIGTRRGWWPWVHVISGLVIGEALLQGLVSITVGSWTDAFWVRAATFVATPLVAAAWLPLGSWLRERSEGGLGMLMWLNGLNVADAVLTEIAVVSGRAMEVNPLIDLAGWPAKIVGVGLASWLLWRYRPQTLVWPTLALGAVFLWHLVGLAVGT